MGKVKIHAGDIGKRSIDFDGSYFSFYESRWSNTKISASNISSLEIATEENIKSISGTFAGGIIGGVILGPVGMIGGLLLGGNKKEVTFAATFNDGKKIFATTDSLTFTKIQAVHFDSLANQEKASERVLSLEELNALFPDMSNDELYSDVLAFSTEKKEISISVIQDNFKIDFNRAARFIEQMELDGIIGPSDGFGSRKVIDSRG